MSHTELANVSRETIDRLRAFEALVQKWSPKINLVSKSDLSELWGRHIVDSLQIFNLAPCEGKWVDLGSGGGFPGVVAAILSQGAHSAHEFYLVESDLRKCAFLRTAGRELELNLTVLSDRIEKIAPLEADILTARALAELPLLLEFCEMHLKPGGTALFPKGATWEKEHEKAQDGWSYACQPIKSETNAAAAVLKIQDIARV